MPIKLMQKFQATVFKSALKFILFEEKSFYFWRLETRDRKNSIFTSFIA